MNRHLPFPAGFTLVEMLIALAAGAMIVLTAMVGFRTATQSLTAANRMSVHNEMIGVAMLAGLDEIDRWDEWDDRHDTRPEKRPLRQVKSDVPNPEPAPGEARTRRLGLPFTPFKSVWSGTQHYGRGWQEDERMWAVSADNPLTWWPGCAAETFATDCRFGRSALFGVSRLPDQHVVLIDGGTVTDRKAWQPRDGGGVYGQIDLGKEPAAGSASYRYESPGWVYNQIRGLGESLGWYGMMDYLPAHVLYSYVGTHRRYRRDSQANPEATDAAGRPIFTLRSPYEDPGSGKAQANLSSRHYAGTHYNLQYWCYGGAPHAIDWLTYYAGFAVQPSHWRSGRGQSLDELVFHHRNFINLNGTGCEEMQPNGSIANNRELMTRYLERTADIQPLMDMRPADWPDCAVTVGRYLRNCRFSNQVKVTWMDPVTGGMAELRFNTMGTTLRGARRMREGGLDR